jgi:hypothetical protein
MNGLDILVHLGGGAAGCVQGADQATHTGTGNGIDWDVILIQPLQDANVGQAASAATAEGETDAGTGNGLRLGRLLAWLLILCRGQSARESQQQYETEPR